MGRAILRNFQANRSGGPPQFITLANRKALAPFVLFDAGGSQREDWLSIDWHPHSGVATMTMPYGTNMHHQDTDGNQGMIEDGGFQWMASGGGVWHKEEYEPKNGRIGILQLWAQLPPESESGPVEYFNLQPKEIPVSGNTRVVLGKYGKVVSPAKVPVDLTYLDVSLKSGEKWTYQPPKSQSRGFVFPKKGTVLVEGTAVGQEIMGMFEENDQAIEIEAKSDTEFVVALTATNPHPTVHEYGQMHTNRMALEEAKTTIYDLGMKLRNQGKI